MAIQENFIDIPIYGSLEKRNLIAICKSLGYDVEGYEIDWLKVTHVILKEAYCLALTSYITHDMEIGLLKKEIILSNNSALARLQVETNKESGLRFEYLDMEHHKHVSSGHIRGLTLQDPWFSTVLDFSENNANIAGIVVRLYFKGNKKPKRVVPPDLASLWNAMIGFQELPKEVVVMKDHPAKLYALYGKKFTGYLVLRKVLVDDADVKAGDLILNDERKIVKATESGKAIAVRDVKPCIFAYPYRPYSLAIQDCDYDKQHADLFISLEGKKKNGIDRINSNISGTFDPIHKEFNFTCEHPKVIGMVVDTSDITITSDDLKVKDEFIYDGKSEKSMAKEPMLYATVKRKTKEKKKVKVSDVLLLMHVMNQNKKRS